MDGGIKAQQAMAAEMEEIAKGVVKDDLVVLQMPEIKGWTRHDQASVMPLFRKNEDLIKKTFANNEYLKLDVTHGEILGLHSTSKLGDKVMPDLPVMNRVINENSKYKEADIWNIANVETIYK